MKPIHGFELIVGSPAVRSSLNEINVAVVVVIFFESNGIEEDSLIERFLGYQIDVIWVLIEGEVILQVVEDLEHQLVGRCLFHGCGFFLFLGRLVVVLVFLNLFLQLL